MSIRQRLIRDLLLPVDFWRSGDLPRLRYLEEFERTQFLRPERLRDLQLERLGALLEHAYRECPYYRASFDRAGVSPRDLTSLDDLAAFPILEKRHIQDHRDAMVARNAPESDRVSYQTGGSTGTSLSFYVSRDRLHSRWAAAARHDRWAGWDIGQRVAMLWGAPRDEVTDTLKVKLRKLLLGPKVFLNTGQLTEDLMAEFHRVLLRFRPEFILAYARSAGLFARFLKARGLEPVRPRSIVTAAEVLEDEDRAIIEEVFGCPVFNRYGCREVGVIATECAEHRGLHLMGEGIYLEVVRNGRPAAPGEDGELLVTDLLNRAMPLIRYRIGDVGAWDEGPCPCGRALPRLRRVTGRATDFLISQDGRMVAGPFLAHSLVAKCPGLGRLQIRQDRLGSIHLRIQPNGRFAEPSDSEAMRAIVRKYLGETTDVTWELVDELPSEPSGKFLFCRSSVAPRFLASQTADEPVATDSGVA